MLAPDAIICGAGIIGLSLAFELNRLGNSVLILESGTAASQASHAAAGMLAASDPENPPQLRALAALSLQLYPTFLDRIRASSGLTLPIQTNHTLQQHHSFSSAGLTAPLNSFLAAASESGGDFAPISEQSLDPRQLAVALTAAVRSNGISLLENTAVRSIDRHRGNFTVDTTDDTFGTSTLIDCTGAWSNSLSHLPVAPVKGQMIRLRPSINALRDVLGNNTVVRTPEIYIVPRLDGTALVGATVEEDAGFDTTTHPLALLHLQQQAAALIPSLADCPVLESWAGLRPGTPDHLPILGHISSHPRHFISAGHLRNGILLAPATAHVMAELILGKPTSLDLTPYAPARFESAAAHRAHASIFGHTP